MSDSVQPHRLQPTRIPCPWDSPGKSTGVGCHCLLQCMKVKSEVAQSCPTPSDPMDCGPPGSSIHGIFQARVLEWGAIAFWMSCICTVSYYLAVERDGLVICVMMWMNLSIIILSKKSESQIKVYVHHVKCQAG